MMFLFFIYLAKASVGIAAFALAYRFFLRQLTYFEWNRWYLLSGLFISLFFPLLPFRLLLPGSFWYTGNEPTLFNFTVNQLFTSPGSVAQALPAEGLQEQAFPFVLITYLALVLYLMGCLYKSWRLFVNLWSIKKMIGENEAVSQGTYCIVRTQQSIPAFSFLRYIFLQAGTNNLSEEELARVLHHEQVHVDQKHSFDLLFVELAAVLLWFNPAIYYLGSQLREVHEFQADASAAHARGNVKQYGTLLLKLATQHADQPILHTFSSHQIAHRIQMLTQTKSNPMQKLRFLAIVPAAAITIALSSFVANDRQGFTTTTTQPENMATGLRAQEAPIRKISWVGNKAYTDAQLSKALGLNTGDAYSKGQVDNLLQYTPAKTDITSLYMDHGYMFFSITPKETFTANAVDLEFTINEGPKVKIGEVRVSGNTKISTSEILKKVNIKKGELFSRSKLMAAQQALTQMGYFDAEKITINPIPNEAAGTTDIEFMLTEK
jgi:hypothetical protein